MNLDQLTIEIRPRGAWEAVDLGLLMARRWWWPMTKVWLLLTAPLFLLLSFLPDNWLWLSYMLIWWLKPLFERPLLHILSQAVFNQMPDTRAALKMFPELARRQLFKSLTWRRFSPSRSMDLPVIQLEGLRGARRSERLDILHREDSSPASWLTIIGVHLEAFFGIGMALLLYALMPSEIHIEWMELFTSQDAAWFVFLTNCCNYLAMTMVAPFYVACGFSLYLNRRIKLEAWDIDIAFQRIVNRRSHTPANTLVSLLLAITLAITFGRSPATMADTAAPSTTSTEVHLPYQRDSAKASIEAVLAGDEFHQKKTIRLPKFSFEEKEKKNADKNGFWKWFFGLFKSTEKMVQVATGLELILWSAILCLIFFLVFRYRHWLAAYLPQSVPAHNRNARPVTLFGLDLTRESLPENISASALSLWRSGDQRPALALLYRASLSRLLEHGLDIDDGHTEEECLRAAQTFVQKHPQAQPAIDYFAQLTRIWQHLAYGHIAPDAKSGEHLCSRWNAIWDFAENTQGQRANRE